LGYRSIYYSNFNSFSSFVNEIFFSKGYSL